MKYILTILVAMIFSAFSASATTYTFQYSQEDWTKASNWIPSYPGTTINANDSVIIPYGYLIKLTGNTSIQINGTLMIGNAPNTYNTTLQMYGNSTLNVGTTGKIYNPGWVYMLGLSTMDISGYVEISSGYQNCLFLMNASKIIIQPSGHLFIEDSIYVDLGTQVTVNGTLTNDGIIWNDGIINGTGSIVTSTSTANGNIVGTGTVSPGLSPGELKTDFSMDLAYIGSLEIEIGGTVPGNQYDVLGGTGDKKLGGTLNVLLYNNYIPTSGESYTIIKGGAITDTFSTVNFPALPNNMVWELIYNSTDVVLKVNAPNAVNDFNTFNNISLYPNPTKGLLFVNGLENEKYIYNIYTISGQKIQAGEIKNGKILIEPTATQLLFVEITDAQNNSIVKPINLID